MIRLVLPLAALAALTACSDHEEEQPVGVASQSEAEALDDAAAMIEQSRLPEDALAPADAAAEASETGDDAAAETGA